jgi:methionyl-tRNA formyltransferase
VTATAAARIAFAGTPEFAVPCLNALLARGFAVDLVFTQPDRPAGRGRKLTPSPVKQAALNHGIEVRQPLRLDAQAREQLPTMPPELLIVVAYGLILPQWMLAWPATAAINVHASLLPRWRGASPIQQAILAGDAETGVSIMRMTSGLDRGPVYRQRAIPVGPRETAGSLHDLLASAGAALLIETLPQILAGTLEARTQDDSGACYAPRIEKRDALLDWTRPALELERKVRAFNPWPVAETATAGGERLRIWLAEARTGGEFATPGTIVATNADGIDVASGDGLLRLLEVQPPGGRVMSAAAYLAAHPLDGMTFVGVD